VLADIKHLPQTGTFFAIKQFDGNNQKTIEHSLLIDRLIIYCSSFLNFNDL